MTLFEEMINKVTPLSARSAVIACYSLTRHGPKDDSWTVRYPIAGENLRISVNIRGVTWVWTLRDIHRLGGDPGISIQLQIRVHVEFEQLQLPSTLSKMSLINEVHDSLPCTSLL
jgi:hypothetical protein